MKKIIFLIFIFLSAVSITAQKSNSGYPIDPVSFTSVKVTDDFWSKRLQASREVTIPLAFSKCEESGRYENFIKAANPSSSYKVEGFSFDDTDVYKTIEGASFLLQTYPDKKLEEYIDSILVIVANAQEPDGYLYTSRTMNPEHPHQWAGSKRWENEEDMSHEFYNLGHMIEAAIAYYQATGKRNFLNIAIKYADCVGRAVGNNPEQLKIVPGHQIAEMALAKLYVITGETKYLDLAKFFLDNRGYTSRKDAYSQAHKPILQQDEAVGHAVRAGYMYTGIADVAALTGDTAYINAIGRIWENVVNKKIYITGGIGSRHEGEAFGDNYELPNLTAYNETCAAISNVYWNYRMFLLHGDSKYYDVLERSLYNAVLAGVSLDGGSFFYPNPLESDGKYEFNQGACSRQPWFGCACCPSNISRFIPSVPGYIYAIHNDNLYVNLFIGNTSEVKIKGKKVKLEQFTSYPWDGNIHLKVTPSKKEELALKIRIPGWVRDEVLPGDLYKFENSNKLGYTIKVNGDPIDTNLDKGYVTINRLWKKDDLVEIHFDMEPRLVKANDHVIDDRGKVAIERGPIVYCAEWKDNDFDIFSSLLGSNPQFTVQKSEDLSGITRIKASVQVLDYDKQGLLEVKNEELSLIPYYAWNHRGIGKMAVWFPQDVSTVRVDK